MLAPFSKVNINEIFEMNGALYIKTETQYTSGCCVADSNAHILNEPNARVLVTPNFNVIRNIDIKGKNING